MDLAVMRRLALGGALAAGLATLGGCATVKPYEREALTRPEMDTAERSAAAERFRAHLHDSRRGAMTGGGAGGGGCGCN